jgi:hypothetical protein
MALSTPSPRRLETARCAVLSRLRVSKNDDETTRSGVYLAAGAARRAAHAQCQLHREGSALRAQTPAGWRVQRRCIAAAAQRSGVLAPGRIFAQTFWWPGGFAASSSIASPVSKRSERTWSRNMEHCFI